jgi:hypothetical protein
MSSTGSSAGWSADGLSTQPPLRPWEVNMKCPSHWPPAKEFTPVKKRNKSFLGSDEQQARHYFMCRGSHKWLVLYTEPFQGYDTGVYIWTVVITACPSRACLYYSDCIFTLQIAFFLVPGKIAICVLAS